LSGKDPALVREHAIH